MESGNTAHHTIALKNIYTLSLAILTSGMLYAQSNVASSELVYNNQTKLYTLRTTNKPYTGRAYSLNYYSQTDTMLRQMYTNGKMDWSITYSAGKPIYHQVYYNKKLKKDSICYEYWTFDATYGDTTYYEVHWIDKNKAKWSRVKNYHNRYYTSQKPNVLASVQTYRFYSKADTKDFTDPSFTNPAYYDSAGYHTMKDAFGYYATYHASGKLQMEAWQCAYEKRVQGKGAYSYYDAYCGLWKYYNGDGVLYRVDEYVGGTYTPITTQYHPNGKIASKVNYKKKGSEIQLPPTQGMSITASEEYTVTTYWHETGKISSETVRNTQGDNFQHSWQANGKPVSVTAHTAQNKPFGVHKTWDEQGRVTDYINYSVEWIDTVCYKAQNGKIIALNLRDRSVPLNWNQMPVSYYNNESRNYLYSKASVYKVFHGNGRLKSEVELKNGKMDGLYHEYDSTGTQILLATYHENVPNGAWTEWYANGKVKKSYNYKDGMRNGSCTEYYPTGGVKWENIYENGTSGKPQAYSENGTKLASETYLASFYPAACLETQARSVRGAALHYYFMDTSMSRSSVTIADTVVNEYVYKVIAVTSAINPGIDPCSTEPAFNNEDEFDIYHSCFVLSKSLYTEANLQKIRSFFARHNITLDKTVPSENPVLGLEKEYLVYYSGKQMLNKQVIIDSLETYIVPRAIDAKQGYILSVDNNVPVGSITGVGSHATFTSDTGHCTIVVESGARNSSYPQYNTFRTTKYIVYDDLTCDVLPTVYETTQPLYWAGR